MPSAACKGRASVPVCQRAMKASMPSASASPRRHWPMNVSTDIDVPAFYGFFNKSPGRCILYAKVPSQFVENFDFTVKFVPRVQARSIARTPDLAPGNNAPDRQTVQDARRWHSLCCHNESIARVEAQIASGNSRRNWNAIMSWINASAGYSCGSRGRSPSKEPLRGLRRSFLFFVSASLPRGA